jgi:HK97 gp10 family phage protein
MEVQGFDELLKTLEQQGKNIEEIKETALVKGAELLQEAIKNNTPVDESVKYLQKKYSPGQHLRDNIIVSPMFQDNYIIISPLKTSRGDFYYAKMLEYGTTNMTARPFFEPTVISKRNEVIDLMRNYILSQI